MAKGLRIPMGVNPSGGAALVEGDANDMKTLKAALGSDDNENAFQQGFGMGDGMIFDIADAGTRNRITRRLVEIFRRFEAQKRYILRPETIAWDYDSAEQTTTLSFLYLNVESDEDKTFRQAFSRARSSKE